MEWTWSNLSHRLRRFWGPNARAKVIALFLWLSLFAVYEWYTLTHGLNQLDILQQLVVVMQTSEFGPLLFILFYAFQPLLFFPSWLLSVAAGYVYGPGLGFGYLLVAINLAALVAYGMGYFFGDGVLAPDNSDAPGGQSRLYRYTDRLRTHSFETILFMRLLMLPFDALSYLAGFLHLRLFGFLLATLLGAIPTTLAFALFGASIEGGLGGQPVRFNRWNMVFSIVLFTVSISAWRLLRGRFRDRDEEQHAD